MSDATICIQRNADSWVALGSKPKRWADLLCDVARIDRALPRGRGKEVAILCEDRYFFAASLFACWRRGKTALLPSGESRGSFAERHAIPSVLHDGQSEGIDVAALLDRAPRSSDGEAPNGPILIEARRHLLTIFTSGSTGEPAAYEKTGTQILNEASLLTSLFGFGSDTRVLSTAPSHHIYGLLFGVLAPLLGTSAFSRATPRYPDSVARQWAGCEANVLVSLPVHLAGIATLRRSALPGIREIFSSGAPLPPETADAVESTFARKVTEILGSTETGGMAWRKGGQDWRPMPGVEIGADEGGHLLIQSPFLAAGVKQPLRVADRVEVSENGHFRHLGRTDSVVKIGGERVSLNEVESHLRSIPGVSDVKVIAVPVGGLRQYELWSAVVAPGLEVARLRSELMRSMRPVAVPRRFRLVSDLPRELNGKITHGGVRQLFENGSGGD
jgi:acyl-coenzyme A synthetase/AMP-(fatty) acid ligase